MGLPIPPVEVSLQNESDNRVVLPLLIIDECCEEDNTDYDSEGWPCANVVIFSKTESE